MKSHIIEYYDRINHYHGIGTFYNSSITKGDYFIVPSRNILKDDCTSIRSIWVGCAEGRENHPAYLKPLLLKCSILHGR